MLTNKKSWKLMFITLVAVLTISVLSACGGDKKDVVATYKGGEITLKEYNSEKNILTFLSPQMEQLVEKDEFKTYLVNQQIAFAYLSSKASEEAKTSGTKLATEQLAEMKKSVGDDAFKKMLAEKKLTEAEIKGYLEQVMISMQDMNSKITDADVKAEYATTKQDYTVASLRHILISLTDAKGKTRTKEEALKIAKDVKSQLDKGADFATLAKKYSEDPGSKDAGGLYKDKSVGTWVKAFKESALTLPLNKISEPIETEYGYHIMRVESRTETAFDKLTQAQKDTIKNKLGSGKIDEFMSKDLPGIIKKVTLPKSPKAATEDKTTPKGGQGSTGTNGTKTEGTDAPTDSTGK